MSAAVGWPAATADRGTRASERRQCETPDSGVQLLVQELARILETSSTRSRPTSTSRLPCERPDCRRATSTKCNPVFQSRAHIRRVHAAFGNTGRSRDRQAMNGKQAGSLFYDGTIPPTRVDAPSSLCTDAVFDSRLATQRPFPPPFARRRRALDRRCGPRLCPASIAGVGTEAIDALRQGKLGCDSSAHVSSSSCKLHSTSLPVFLKSVRFAV